MRTTVATFLTRNGLPADWRYASPLGRVAADIYRRTYGREPGTTWQLIHGKFRTVMAYSPSERHVLTEAWQQYTPGPDRPTPRPRTVLGRIDRALADWYGSGDSMRWQPAPGPLRPHPEPPRPAAGLLFPRPGRHPRGRAPTPTRGRGPHNSRSTQRSSVGRARIL